MTYTIKQQTLSCVRFVFTEDLFAVSIRRQSRLQQNGWKDREGKNDLRQKNEFIETVIESVVHLFNLRILQQKCIQINVGYVVSNLSDKH